MSEGAPRYFEDVEPGEVHEAGPVVLTRDAIVGFAQVYDPQPFHLDEAAGERSLLGGLSASGWQTASIGMRLLFEAFVGGIACMGSPGVDDLRWLKPVRPGGALRVRVTVGAKRLSASRPDRGFLGVSLEVLDDAGDVVMTQRFTIILQRRGATQSGAGQAPAPVIAQQTALPEAEPMLTAFYDDVAIGHTATLGTQHFSAEEIVAFATLYDPQYFHVDAEAARASHFGGLCASGWQTAGFWMKHYIAARTRSATAREANGLVAAVGGPSPGFTDMKWLRPVHAGQTVTYGLTVRGKRRAARGGWGMVMTDNTGHLADGTLAFSFSGRLLWPLAPT